MTRDLTEGKIGRSLILFSIPMILGNVLQQIYNIADTLIVGKTLGPSALSAVGSAYALMVLLTSIILGFCIGSGVVFAQLYGAKRLDELKIGIYNAFLLITAVTVGISVASFLLLEQFLIWLHIPPQAVEFTREYLQVIFVGMAAVSVYNFFAAILRSIGNSVVPLLFLAISAVTNIVLDIVFIVSFHMGVAGAAWATVIAQVLSAVCIVVYFFMKAKTLCPARRHMHYNKTLLRFVFSNSVLTAVQQSIMNLGILLVQGLVNSFGYFASAAFAVVVKIDAFAYMPAQDFGNAFSTFIAQNYGANRFDRIRRGAKVAGGISVLFCAAASACVCLLAKPLMLLFVNAREVEIIRIGMQYLYIEGACYMGIGVLFLLYGFYRGIAKPTMSIVLTVVSLGVRVALAYFLAAIPGVGLSGIWWAVPIGWVLADIVGVLYYWIYRDCMSRQG